MPMPPKLAGPLHHGQKTIAILSVAAGPIAALAVLTTWATSVLLYAYGGWSADSSPTGLRWLLDGPLVQWWRKVAGWVLSQMHIPAATAPIHYSDGSSVSHIPGTLHALGLLNEAALAAVVTMCGFVIGNLVYVKAQFSERAA
jgi:hypothetical protein